MTEQEKGTGPGEGRGGDEAGQKKRWEETEEEGGDERKAWTSPALEPSGRIEILASTA